MLEKRNKIKVQETIDEPVRRTFYNALSVLYSRDISLSDIWKMSTYI